MDLLQWESNFFDRKIALLDGNKAISPNQLKQNVAETKMDMIQVLCSVQDRHKIKTVEEEGFHLADIKIEFKLELNAEQLKLLPLRWISVAKESDEERILQISTSLFSDSRFYGYEHIFEKKKVDLMFEIWLRKSIVGNKDDYCMVYKHDEKILAFATVKEDKQTKTARIGLFGVSASQQGKGIGDKLLKELGTFLYSSREIETVYLSTQGKNKKAMNFYAKNGFRITDMSLWYYWIAK